MSLISLLTEAHMFERKLQIKLLKVLTTSGICCCFSPRAFVFKVTGFLKETNSNICNLVAALFEHVLFIELGSNSTFLEDCGVCNKLQRYDWNFLELYGDLLTPYEPKLCSAIMVHLLKVTPTAGIHVKENLLFKVFHPTLLRTLKYFEEDSSNEMVKFLIHACLYAIAILIANVPLFEKLMEIDGLAVSFFLFFRGHA